MARRVIARQGLFDKRNSANAVNIIAAWQGAAGRGWARHGVARQGKELFFLGDKRMAKSGLFQKSADTSIVENRLRKTVVGEVVTYGELTTLLGRDSRDFCRSNINSARRSLELESIFFDAITGEGLRRLTESEAVTQTAPSYVSRAKSAAQRGMRVLSHVDFAGLDDATKRHHLSTSAQLGVIGLFASNKAANRIESKVSETSSAIAIGETLKLFGG